MFEKLKNLLINKFLSGKEATEYKAELASIQKSLKVGQVDNSGQIITKIFVAGDEYAVYEIKTDILSESLRTFVFPKTKEDVNKIEARFDGIRIKYSQVKGLLYKASDDSSIKTQIAHILSHALSGHVDEANMSLDNLINTINEEYRSQLRHRSVYLITTLLMVTVLLLTSILTYYENYFLDNIQIRNLIYISAASSIGGFVSVSRKLRSTIFEKDASSWVFVLYAIERVSISVIAGFIAYTAIICKIAFSIVSELSNPIWGYILFAVVAGFSETLIPGLLSKLEQENK